LTALIAARCSGSPAATVSCSLPDLHERRPRALTPSPPSSSGCWPALWALPILTKITPGIGLLWFLVRGEWRSLGIAALATGLIVAVSGIADPLAWGGWLSMLARADFPELGGGLWFLPLPLGFRLFVAAALIAWGAATDRRWVLPVGVCLSLPTVWLNTPTILSRFPAAGARTPAGAWLRRTASALGASAAPGRLERWLAPRFRGVLVAGPTVRRVVAPPEGRVPSPS
jgi:hypothetical protein